MQNENTNTRTQHHNLVAIRQSHIHTHTEYRPILWDFDIIFYQTFQIIICIVNGSFKFMFNNNKISNKWKRETNYIYIISEKMFLTKRKKKKQKMKKRDMKYLRWPNFRQRPHQFAEQDTQDDYNNRIDQMQKKRPKNFKRDINKYVILNIIHVIMSYNSIVYWENEMISFHSNYYTPIWIWKIGYFCIMHIWK